MRQASQNALIATLLALLLPLLSSPVLACPFCAPAEADLYSDVESAQAVVLAKRLEARKYQVTEVLTGATSVGKVIIAAEPKNRDPGNGTLLLTTAGSATLPYWSDAPRYLTASELTFARQALQVAQKNEQARWDFAARHLGHPATEIALSAYSILATAPLNEVQARATIVGNEKLRSWVQDPKRPEDQRALMLLMLIPGLSSKDLAWVEAGLFSNSRASMAPTFGPLIVAYTKLSGPAGVKKISQRFLEPSLPPARTLDVTRALALVVERSGSPDLKNAVVEVFKAELQNPDRGAFAIAPLAFWEVYEVAPQVERLGQRAGQATWIKVAAIRYFRSFSNPDSKAALQRLAKTDADLVARIQDPYRRQDLGID